MIEKVADKMNKKVQSANKQLADEKHVNELLQKEVKLLRSELDVCRNLLKTMKLHLKHTETAAEEMSQNLIHEISNLTRANNEATLANTVLLARLEEYEAGAKTRN